MITLDLFKKIILAIKEQSEIDQEVSKSLEKVCDSWVMFNTKNKVYPLVPMLLKEIFNDKGDWIEYWMWNCSFGKKYGKGNGELCAREKGGKYIDIKTIEKLYKYLIKERKK